MTSIVPIIRKPSPYAWTVDLRDAVVVVTDASAEIGKATALRFAQTDSHTVLAARQTKRLKTLASAIHSHKAEALPVTCDVTKPEDIARLVDSTINAYDRCDVLVNNTKIPNDKAFQDVSTEQIERLVQVNLLGVLLVTKAFLPHLLDRQTSHVINVASITNQVATPSTAVYRATKHDIVAFSKTLSAELQPSKILVTAVNPNLTQTKDFPQTDLRRPFVMKPDRIAETIVDVMRRKRAPEVSVPQTLALLQMIQIVTPPLYQ